MEVVCRCGKSFEIDGESARLPKHKDQDGDPCTGSNLSAEDIQQLEEARTCPRGLDASCCATCEDQSCLNEDDDDEEEWRFKGMKKNFQQSL